MKKSKAYNRGKKDFSLGEKWTDNPYRSQSEQQYDWQSGWLEANNKAFDKSMQKIKDNHLHHD